MTVIRPQLDRDAIRQARRPAKQTIDIEPLLGWTYRIQQADMELQGSSPLADICEGYGFVPRGSVSCAGHLFYVDPDARRVHQVVTRTLDVPRQRLLIEHARGGTQPDWCDGVIPRLVMKPRIDPRSGLPVINRQTRQPEPSIVWIDRDGNPTPRAAEMHNYGYCELEQFPSRAYIEFCRDIYRAWWRAMASVVEALQRVDLQRWIATGPRAPFEPWATGS